MHSKFYVIKINLEPHKKSGKKLKTKETLKVS